MVYIVLQIIIVVVLTLATAICVYVGVCYIDRHIQNKRLQRRTEKTLSEKLKENGIIVPEGWEYNPHEMTWLDAEPPKQDEFDHTFRDLTGSKRLLKTELSNLYESVKWEDDGKRSHYQVKQYKFDNRKAKRFKRQEREANLAFQENWR